MISDNPSRIVIGLVGRKGSGKGTVASILKEKGGASVYRFSDVLRETLDQLFIEKSREHLILLSEILRKGFGEDVLQRAMVKRVEHDPSALVVIDGLRRIGDLEGLDVLGNFHLVSIEAPPEIRFERLRARGENAGETTRTYESFLELEQAPTEVTIADVEARADFHIDNRGDREQLEEKIEEMMRNLIPPLGTRGGKEGF